MDVSLEVMMTGAGRQIELQVITADANWGEKRVGVLSFLSDGF